MITETKFTVRYDRHTSRNWSSDPMINELFLRVIKNQMLDQLRARGHVFLNEVYDQMGLRRTSSGQLVGWLYFGDGEEVPLWEETSKQDKDGNSVYIIEFETQGVIYDKIEGES